MNKVNMKLILRVKNNINSIPSILGKGDYNIALS